MLFSIVNLARFLQVDSELALISCNRKFKTRFQYVEKKVKQSGKDWSDYSLAELDEFWNESKKS